jgi:hypothetical protein
MFRESFMYNRAPEITPVSYPNKSPPRVEITVSRPRYPRRLEPPVVLEDVCNDIVASLIVTTA